MVNWKAGSGTLGLGQQGWLIQSAAKARALGMQMSDKQLGAIVHQVRKYLSTSFIRAQTLSLINRLSYLGEGPQVAAGRRTVARQLEEGKTGLLHGPLKRLGALK